MNDKYNNKINKKNKIDLNKFTKFNYFYFYLINIIRKGYQDKIYFIFIILFFQRNNKIIKDFS